MNVFERPERLLDAGSSGTMNWIVIAGYRGCFDVSSLQGALAALQSTVL